MTENAPIPEAILAAGEVAVLAGRALAQTVREPLVEAETPAYLRLVTGMTRRLCRGDPHMNEPRSIRRPATWTAALILLAAISCESEPQERRPIVTLGDQLYHEADQTKLLYGQMQELSPAVPPDLLAVFDSTLAHMSNSVTALEETASGWEAAEQAAVQMAEHVEDQLMMERPPPGMGRMEYVMEYIPAAKRDAYRSAKELQDALFSRDQVVALIIQAQQARAAASDLYLRVGGGN